MADRKELLTPPGGFSFYMTAVEIYNGYKISKDGESRKEDVAVMQGLGQEEQIQNRGWRIFKRVFGKKEDDGSERAEPQQK